MKQPNLEREIVEALRPDGNVTSGQLQQLLERIESAIQDADRVAVAAKEQAYDPAVYPDPKAARQALEDAIFAAGRLLTLKPRLVFRLQQVAAAEEHARWLVQYEELKAKIAAAAERWSENYADCIADLANLIAENESFAADILRVNLAAPANEPRRLRSPELTARNEPMGTRSILDDLKLVDLDGTVVWPLPQRLDPSVYAPMIGGDPRATTGDWWQVGAEARERRAVEEQELLRQNAAEHAKDFGRMPAAE